MRLRQSVLDKEEAEPLQPGQINNPQPLKGGCNHMIPDQRPGRTG
jgi:hypothetical protein